MERMLKGTSCPPLKIGWDRGIFADFDIACQTLIHHPARGTYNVWVLIFSGVANPKKTAFAVFTPIESTVWKRPKSRKTAGLHGQKSRHTDFQSGYALLIFFK